MDFPVDYVNNDSLSNDSLYLIPLPSIQCEKLKLLGSIFIVVFLLSVYLNGSVLLIFLRSKNLTISINLFLFVLISFNLTGTLLEFPLVIANHFNCRYFWQNYKFNLEYDFLSLK